MLKQNSSTQTQTRKETKIVHHILPVPSVSRHDEFESVCTGPNSAKTEASTVANRCIEAKSGLRVGGLLQTWADLSRINYFSSMPMDIVKRGQSFMRRRSTGVEDLTPLDFPTLLRLQTEKEILEEKFPVNVTTLMNEDQYWGCFFVFPELYEDVYSPVIQVFGIESVQKLVNGVLTQEMVAAYLSYLKRTPILGDLVLIKLDLVAKSLVNIEVLQYYKYLVCLDLSSNLLTDISVLSKLPYLQYITVNFNRLETVLEYDPPQWFLSEVHYRYNSVKVINDLTKFWSITILDLSHNNIKAISGLKDLRYLRRLDLSFNHIQKIENLNNLRLIWLDLSYNNISCFEFGASSGLWTMLHLEYLNVNENNLTSMRMFSGMYRLRELHARNNRFGTLLDLAVYTRQMRRLIVLDLRANPVCSTPGYKDVVLNTYPALLNLDSEKVDPVEHRSAQMDFNPRVEAFAARRLMRLLYVQQLLRARVPHQTPPADTTAVPLIVLVGCEAVGKGTLARRLATECSDHVELGKLHTTANYHYEGHYIEITRQKFDDMILAGEFLTYRESNGESYGLSLDQSVINPGKVRLVCMELLPALMLTLRGRRSVLILVTRDKAKMAKEQILRKRARETMCQRSIFASPLEKSTLQVLLSGRIVITGILNEILLNLPDEKTRSEFRLEPECSLLMDSESRQAAREHAGRTEGMTSSAFSSQTSVHMLESGPTHQGQESIFSLYKDSQGTEADADNSDVGQDNSYSKKRQTIQGDLKETVEIEKNRKSVDFSHYTSSTWKVPERSKSSKSVTFTPTEQDQLQVPTTSGMMVDPPLLEAHSQQKSKAQRSISTKLPWPPKPTHTPSNVSVDEDIWLHFLVDTGLLRASVGGDKDPIMFDTHATMKMDEMIDLMNYYLKISYDTQTTTNIRDEYEDVHRNAAGTFLDTICTDNPKEAFRKLKRIVKDIVNSQKRFKPMFDIDFTNLDHYPTVKKRLKKIREQVAPTCLFH